RVRPRDSGPLAAQDRQGGCHRVGRLPARTSEVEQTKKTGDFVSCSNRGMRRAILILLLAGCGSAERSDGGLRVGVATVDITPPVGYRLGGYFKDRFAAEIRDPLYAKALVLSQD